MNNATARKRTQLTIGLDLGDRRHTYYVLDGAGKMAREGSLGNTRQQLATMARSYPGATVVMEAGTHSPWVSRFLQELGLRVIVANPRKTRAIYQNERKSDRRDAMMLARLARMDPTLLHPVEHGSQEAQQDMLQLKLRDSLVRARVALINAVRFTLKSLGYPVSNPSSERFHKLVLSEVPESIGEMIAHNVAAIAELTQRIKALGGLNKPPGRRALSRDNPSPAGQWSRAYYLALLRAQSGDSRSLPANARHRSLPGLMPEAGPKRRD